MKARAHVFISGAVQGVFFRSETRHVARNYGVTGWIRNLPDGRAEAVIEGEEKNIRKIIDFCRKGPPAAKVTNVEVSWETYSGTFDDFETR